MQAVASRRKPSRPKRPELRIHSVSILICAEWRDDSNGKRHIDNVRDWIKRLADEINKAKKYPFDRNPVQTAIFEAPPGEVINPKILHRLQGPQIIIADVSSSRGGQHFNHNVVYELGAAMMLRHLNQQSKGSAGPRVIPVCDSALVGKIPKTISNIGGLGLLTYSDTGTLVSPQDEWLKRQIRKMHRELNQEAYDKTSKLRRK